MRAAADGPGRLVRDIAVRKAGRRLVPLLALLYFVSFLDRVNIGFAALQMNADIGLSHTSFGFGAGIFFLGYIFFAVPSNLMMRRLGAALWIALISIGWGVTSAATASVHTPAQFYVLRFLLGAIESGFFPGVIFYLSTWFPDEARGRIIGWFFLAVPLSNVVGAPISSHLLTSGLFGFTGWQTMFVIEALPAIFLGILARFLLIDSPKEARWLSVEERSILTGSHSREGTQSILLAILDPGVWHSGVLYFLLVLSLYGTGFFMPLILSERAHLSPIETGWATALPYLIATLVMIPWSYHSDRTHERSYHLALAAIVGAVGFFTASFGSGLIVIVAGFTLAASGIYAACPIFWTITARGKEGAAAAASIGLVNALGNIAGFAGPWVMGAARDFNGGYGLGLTILAASMLAAGAMTLVGAAKPRGP